MINNELVTETIFLTVYILIGCSSGVESTSANHNEKSKVIEHFYQLNSPHQNSLKTTGINSPVSPCQFGLRNASSRFPCRLSGNSRSILKIYPYLTVNCWIEKKSPLKNSSIKRTVKYILGNLDICFEFSFQINEQNFKVMH